MSASHTDVEYHITVMDGKGNVIKFNKICITINSLLDFLMTDEEEMKMTGEKHSYSITGIPYGGLK